MLPGPDQLWPSKRSFHTACTLVDPNAGSAKQDSSVSSHFEWLPCSPPDFSAPIVGGDFHCVDPKLLVMWGCDNDSEPIQSSWVLNVNSLSWNKVTRANVV